MIVETEHAIYVLQRPAPDYARRWDACLHYFPEKPIFVGIKIEGPAPDWFDPVFWEALKDETRRWQARGYAVSPPTLPALTPQQVKVLKYAANLAAHEARLREYTQDLEACESQIAKLDGKSFEKKARNGKKASKPAAEKRRLADLATLEEQRTELKELLQEQSDNVEAARQEMAKLTRKPLKARVPTRTKHRAPIPPPSPEPISSRPPSALPSSRPHAGPSAPPTPQPAASTFASPAPQFNPQAATILDRTDVVAFEGLAEAAMDVSDNDPAMTDDNDLAMTDAETRMSILGSAAPSYFSSLT